MRIWGKFFGFVIGFMFGRLAGAILGLWLGHMYDRKLARDAGISSGAKRQALFFNTTFAVMGHVAKASGRVTENDIRMATSLMDQLNLSGQARADAQAAFREGKDSDFDLNACLKTFRLISMGRKEVLQMFLEIQIQTALSDAQLDQQERAILSTVAKELGFSQQQLDDLLARWQAEFNFHRSGAGNQTSIKDAYDLLGMSEANSDQEIKRAYRKLMNEHHPDKLVAKGLPAEMMELAKTKAQDIQAAYDRVKGERGMR
ncbi:MULTISPECIES: co-chaperone DjlA [Shewanella]|uniref:Co-chaperone protein DjlA n=1 Tax=Shewanella fidelis TaxID=173509 RepID=A0AAW8NQE4_9GAMM|nr:MULTISPECIES: co-chaperone DjlA [Shewanella]MDR8524956.1 co-chaperone DjlA [Shewanella fidelis]MDW4811027.1 co-chaperone DjlA [Shewanella fidelis]MDW4815194.1 co-chaperone DjlA [Shewanella fidelis]MDW4819284.1 co-chaperone DjlA [Shewanella fidelis]MDW4823038.1 co-chaperone DjlA [Shewanella fidelis]